ncbi:MAG: sigma 54-interacting transcriptional regulator [Syntrophomonadaceae bacterium]|nr:sigma 54-interacting transcriptional regulator [Syntrophomonadaceae bacterium]
MTQMQPINTINVGEAMTSDFGRIPGDTAVEKVINIMLQNHWGEVVLQGNGEEGYQLVTKERLMRCVENGFPTQLPVSEIASKRIITSTIDEPLTQARERMRQANIGRLPVLDAMGNIVGMLTSRDVCNGFSDKLEMLSEHMYAILHNISEAIQVIDCQGRVIFWNHSAEDLFGIKAQDIVGLKLEEFFPHDLTLQVISSIESYHNVLCEPRPGVYAVRNAVPIIMPDGEVVGAVSTTTDVSESKTLVEELNRVNSRVKQLEERIVNSEEINKDPFYTINANTKKVLQQAKRVGATDATVLIQGESGTGKELMANVIYQNSKRSKQPFIAVNCSAIPGTLFESEMFGYEAGSFTGGSKTGKQGKFEMANEGTIFLDEIGELPLDMQAKLLRVIQERKFYRVGGTAPVEVNVRLIAATNKDLAGLVAEGKFREDLYYRLNVVTLDIPPLRERRDDIIGLTKRFIKQMECVYMRSISGMDEQVLEMLQAYDWPGNVRQLHNMLESVIILMEDDYISIDSLAEAGALDTLNPSALLAEEPIGQRDMDAPNLEEILLRREREVIIRAMEECKNNKARAAKKLGIPRSTLYYKLKALGISD